MTQTTHLEPTNPTKLEWLEPTIELLLEPEGFAGGGTEGSTCGPS